jgi:hypothetical protein
MRRLVLSASLALAGCASEPLGHYADEIVEAPGATHVSFGDPTRAVNGVRGGGIRAGSLDVYSLDDHERSHLVLAFSERAVTNTPGPDLVVFENGFEETGRDAFFMDPVIVEVSRDGVRWLAFPHDYVAADETVYEPHPEAWEGFAGVTPVVVNVDRDPMDPFSPRAGGDAFDLDELVGETEEERALADEMKREGVRFVRLSSASRAVNPDTGLAYPRDPVSDGADIDGVAARTLAPIDGSR